MDASIWSSEESDLIWPKEKFQDRLISTFDVEQVKRRVGEVDGVEVKGSDDVGNYLCGFCFYTTLAWFEARNEDGKTQADRPVIFLHVPMCSTSEDIEKGVEVTTKIIQSLVSMYLESRQTTLDVRCMDT